MVFLVLDLFFLSPVFFFLLPALGQPLPILWDGGCSFLFSLLFPQPGATRRSVLFLVPSFGLILRPFPNTVNFTPSPAQPRASDGQVPSTDSHLLASARRQRDPTTWQSIISPAVSAVPAAPGVLAGEGIFGCTFIQTPGGVSQGVTAANGVPAPGEGRLAGT